MSVLCRRNSGKSGSLPLLRTVPDAEKKGPWYLRPGCLLTAVLCAGPLALPLFWIHPNLTRRTKIIWTVVVVLLSWGTWLLMQKSIQSIENYYGILQQLY